jgi:hypothetical protein
MSKSEGRAMVPNCGTKLSDVPTPRVAAAGDVHGAAMRLPPQDAGVKRMVLCPRDDYYVVDTCGDATVPAHSDKEPTPEERKAMAERAVIARQARGFVRGPGRSRGKASEVRTILNFTTSFTSVAATDNTTVISLTPSSSTEWAQFQNLWDEVIVDGGHIDFTYAVTTAYTTSNGATRAVCAFDPIDGVALGSLSNGLQHQQHLQFSTAAGQLLTFPTIASPKGYWHFKWKTPRGFCRTSGALAAFGHEWSSTSDAADIYGYLKFYIPQVGATGVYVVYYTWTLDVRFRCRT